MEKIKEIIFNNYELNNEEKELLDNILNSNKDKFDKIFSVIQNLIKFRLDYDTILAYISFEQNFDLIGKSHIWSNGKVVFKAIINFLCIFVYLTG